MNQNERLRKVIYWMISQGLAKNQEDVAFKLGRNESYLSQVLTGVKPVSQKLLTKFKDIYSVVNLAYISTGDGSMVSGKTEDELWNIRYLEMQMKVLNQCQEIDELQKEVIKLQAKIIKSHKC